jgi:hypothetical protein
VYKRQTLLYRRYIIKLAQEIQTEISGGAVMRTPKEIALDIMNGDKKAKAELEKMWGYKFEDMTIEQRRLGVTMLSAFEPQWNK